MLVDSTGPEELKRMLLAVKDSPEADTSTRSADETVYIVDYDAGGVKMTNRKWETEGEIQPAE